MFGSVPGIARRAGITIAECEAALASFTSPDRHSRTPDNDGRRIEPIDGGWRLLNYEKYREMRDTEERRAYQAEWVARKRQQSKNVDKPVDNRPPSTQAEAEEENTKPKPLRAAGAAPAGFERFWNSWPNSPRKVGKAACLRKWKAGHLEEAADGIIFHVETMKLAEQWRKGFEPAPLTYLNQRRWEDGAPGEAPPGEKPWFLTSSAITSKALELGMAYDDVEPWPEFRDRVFAKAGITKSQYDAARKEWGV